MSVDTVRHVDLLRGWIADGQHVVLCGPPGSGKTMTLTSTLQQLSDYDVAPLNFSSATTPDLILKTLEQYCEYTKTAKGLQLAPSRAGRTLVVFCDEINLPQNDAYGTQRVITFLRQILESEGFWHPRRRTWVHVERVQFVGACNPPTDPGRVPLSQRFMRHTPILLVDFPAEQSLRHIYGAFVKAMLKLTPNLRQYAQPVTDAMVDAYAWNRVEFKADEHAHYVYSPRELSRWTRAIYEAVQALNAVTLEELVRIWLHEGLRLFHDRLVQEADRVRCHDQLDLLARKHFVGADLKQALAHPVLFSTWMNNAYVSVDQEELRDHVEARLRTFNDEQLNVHLVVFDDVLKHVLRIDRVLRQPLGHLLLVGESGAGKTVLTRFVAWMNGMSVFQIRMSKRYGLADFDADLQSVMRRAGIDGEEVAFIFDESNVLSTAFLERMNALLASGEVPGLFESEDLHQLLAAAKESANRKGVMIDGEEAAFRWFTRQVQRNLHIVFTMNPWNSDFDNRAATSPALFNRCVVDWFGDWNSTALAQVGHDFTDSVAIDRTSYSPPAGASEALQLGAGRDDVSNTFRHAVVAAIVHVHHSVRNLNKSLRQQAETGAGSGIPGTYTSPRDYVNFIETFVKLFRS